MNRYIKVEGHTGFVRDKNTGAVLNINTNEMDRAVKRKAQRRKEKEELRTLKQDVSEMKVLLNKILEATNGSNTNSTK